MAIDKDKDNFILGECKFKNSPFKLSDLESMKNKFAPKNENAKQYYFAFSKSNFTEDVIKEAAFNSNLFLISLDDLF